MNSGIIFTTLKIIMITGDLIEYLQFLGDRLEKVYICSSEHIKDSNMIFEIIPHEKIEYEYRVRFDIDNIGNSRVFIHEDVENFMERIALYLEKYGHKIEVLQISALLPREQLIFTFRLIEKYCVNIRLLDCYRILEDVNLPSLETIQGCETLDKLAKSVNVTHLIECVGDLPSEFVKVKFIYLCKISKISREVYHNLETCVAGSVMSLRKINHDIIKELQLSDRIKSREFVEELKNCPNLESVFVDSKLAAKSFESFLKSNGITWLEVFVATSSFIFNNVAYISLDLLNKYPSIEELIRRKKFHECAEISEDFITKKLEIQKGAYSSSKSRVFRVVEKLPIDTIIDIAVECDSMWKIKFPFYLFRKKHIKRLVLSKLLFRLSCKIYVSEYADIIRILYKYYNPNNKFRFTLYDQEGQDISQLNSYAENYAKELNKKPIDIKFMEVNDD